MGTIATVSKMSARMPGRVGQHLVWEGKVTMPASYATGGDTITAKSLGMSQFMAGQISPAAGVVFEFVIQTDPSTAKIKAYRQKDPAAAGGADIALPEVGNAVDLSALTPQVRITGR